MVARRAEPAVGSRVAVVGSTSPSGLAIRRALERAGVPGSRVGLFSGAEGQATLAEYAGEARLIQELRDDEIERYTVRFACEPGVATRLGRTDSPNSVLVSTWEAADGSAPTVGAVRRAGGTVPAEVRLVHPVALALVRLATGFAAGPGIASWTAVVLRPAADRGERGAEELRAQTAALLSFSSAPTRSLGRRLAFDCVPQAAMPGEPAGLEQRIAEDVRVELGAGVGDVGVRMVWVPAFFGHALVVRCIAREPVEPSRWRELLAVGGVTYADPSEGLPSQASASGEATIRAAVLGTDGPAAAWLWAVADDASASAADEAIEFFRDSGTL